MTAESGWRLVCGQCGLGDNELSSVFSVGLALWALVCQTPPFAPDFARLEAVPVSFAGRFRFDEGSAPYKQPA